MARPHPNACIKPLCVAVTHPLFALPFLTQTGCVAGTHPVRRLRYRVCRCAPFIAAPADGQDRAINSRCITPLSGSRRRPPCCGQTNDAARMLAPCCSNATAPFVPLRDHGRASWRLSSHSSGPTNRVHDRIDSGDGQSRIRPSYRRCARTCGRSAVPRSPPHPPQPHRPVYRHRREGRAVGCDGHTRHAIGMPLEGVQQRSV